MNVNRENGFTLIELLIVIAIIGILAAVGTPHFSSYKTRTYNVHSKDQLHNLFLACKAYWGDNNSIDDCTVAIAVQSTYGFVQAANVTVAVGVGAETTFTATATHTSGDQTYTICSIGNIQTSAC